MPGLYLRNTETLLREPETQMGQGEQGPWAGSRNKTTNERTNEIKKQKKQSLMDSLDF